MTRHHPTNKFERRLISERKKKQKESRKRSPAYPIEEPEKEHELEHYRHPDQSLAD
jgi:hypothetical protein